ncbi:heavy metal sensor histidine kinase [Azohydromonas caseinilytica]|uniref:Sensor protein n=1 Tax=Azohydromonas caseinilytica TaxID=2728836 RepID=A0A848FFH8_9BURK|nr:heavy metal sensor histidine kinase [Azohydromonas caseinilytica]NML17069.1 heavy metal sensor histidine kinase [Azohydromonas caseinilytica]
MRRPLGRSLVWHLSGWQAVQSLMGLALVSMGVYLATAWSLSMRQQETLTQRQVVVEHLLDEAVSDANVGTLRHKLDDFFVGSAGMGLRLTLPDGTALYERTVQRRGSQTRQAAFERRWLPSPQGSVHGELVLDTSADDSLLDRLGAILIVSTLAGAMLISVTGFMLVRRSLSPVLALSRQIRSLGPDGLHGRLDGSGQPEELQPVVKQFNDLLGRLERAYAQLEAFNADVAHELRTPLAALIGHSEVALSRPRSVQELQEVIGTNLEDLQRLAGIVNDMLFLSKADRGARARRTPVPSVAAMASDVAEFHEACLHEAGLQVRVTGDASGAFDAALLRRALSNLLSNATRYASAGTIVDVDVTMPSCDVLQLSVSNMGNEIAREHLPHLFDRFYRAEASREHSDINHGLGLAIVAAIARMHDGETFATSQAGCTTIGLRLPAA